MTDTDVDWRVLRHRLDQTAPPLSGAPIEAGPPRGAAQQTVS